MRLDVSTLSAAMMAAQVLMWKGRVHWHGALTIGFCMGLKMLCEQSFHVGDMKHVTTRYTLRELLAGEKRACELLLGANRCGITPCSPLRHVNIFRSMLCSLLLESTQASPRARRPLHAPKPPAGHGLCAEPARSIFGQMLDSMSVILDAPCPELHVLVHTEMVLTLEPCARVTAAASVAEAIGAVV